MTAPSQHTSPEKRPVHTPRPAATPLMSELKVTLIGALLIAIGPISLALYTPALPELVRYFGTTDAMVKMTVTLYFVGFAAAQLVCGPLSDGVGRRPVIVGFMVIYVVACLLILFTPTIELMLVARVLQGVGAAMGIAISRAIVRDVFADARSFRIMNLMGLCIAIAPAIAPAIGGLTLEFASWRTLFAMMALMGIGAIFVAIFSLRETVTRDLSRIKPQALFRSYRELLTTPYFMLASMVIASAVGAVYALATILPFVLMQQVGLSPTGFGFSQILQAGMFALGAVAVQATLPRTGADKLVPLGLGLLLFACVSLVVLLALSGPTFFSVMAPIALYSFGIAFIMPSMLTNSLMPFPKIAGAASALTAFLQMAIGLLASALAALFTDPSLALAIILPAMGIVATVCWHYWRKLPTPTAGLS